MTTAVRSPPWNSPRSKWVRPLAQGRPLPSIGYHNPDEHLPASSDLRRISAFTDHGPTFLIPRLSRRASIKGLGTGGGIGSVTGGNHPP